MTLASFADLLAPVTVEQFERDHHDRAPLHVLGTPDKVAGVMSWDGLNRLLDMTAIWSSQSLQLALDCRMIPAEQYCRRTRDRDGRPTLEPLPAKVRALLRQGASLLLNDIDTLSPGLRGLAGLVERGVGAKVQINLYCSWREHQAFASHFDSHDVYALQIAGEKHWNVYEGRHEQPVAHPSFKNFGQAHHDAARGRPVMQLTLRPGDLLYLPRGQYHDALTTGDHSIHLAIGATEPIGLDLLGALYEAGLADPVFRRRLPPPGPNGAELGELAHRLRARLADPLFRQSVARLQAGFGFPRGGFPAAPGLRESGVKPK